MITAILMAALLGAEPGQDDAKPAEAPPALPSIDTELKAAATWLQAMQDDGKIAPADAPNFRFFTTYAVPETKLNVAPGEKEDGADRSTTLREASGMVLSFALNSLAATNAEGKAIPPLAVSPTLYAADVRDYGWTVEQFEAAIQTDPYVVEPLVDHALYNFGRLNAGNMLVRADWFIVHAMDSARQVDRGLKADDVIYYTLIYGVGKAPKTLDAFRAAWGVDATLAAKFKADFGTIVEKGRSGVSRGVRRIVGYRTVLGAYWETFDASNEDYVENVLSDKLEAGEAITNNTRGLQVYLLYDGKRNRVEDGNIKLVVDSSDSHDPRVRTATSCVSCHTVGINPCSNALADLVKEGVGFNPKYHEFARRIDRFYLAGTLDATVVEANTRYGQAVAACNGLSPTQNAIAYRALYDWYAYTPVTLAQAAAECGLAEAEYLAKIKASASGRLAGLFRTKRPIDRQFWEAQVVGGAINGGSYAESMLHIKGKTSEPVVLVPAVAVAVPVAVVKPKEEEKPAPMEEAKPAVKPDAGDPRPETHQVVTTEATQLQLQNQVLGELPAGAVLEYTKTVGEWYGVRHEGVAGYVPKAKSRIELKAR